MAEAVLLAGLADGIVQDQFGNALNSRLVNVYMRGTTTQVQVYSDSGLTQTMTQPLTTGGGGVQGGIPGYIASLQSVDFVDVATGIKTQAEAINATGVVVDNSADSTSAIASAFAIYSGTRNRALRDYLSAADAPYSCTGASDCTTNLYHAIQDANYLGRKLYFPSGTYKISNRITVPSGTDPSNNLPMYWEGNGPNASEIQITSNWATSNPAVGRTGLMSTAMAVSSQPAVNQINVSTNQGLAPGQWCEIVDTSQTLIYGLPTKTPLSCVGEWGLIYSVSGTGPYTITFQGDLEFAYTTNATVQILSQDVGQIDMMGLSVRNLNPVVSSNYAQFLSLTRGTRARFHHMAFYDMNYSSLNVQHATDFGGSYLDWYYSQDLQTINPPYNISISSGATHGLFTHVQSTYGRHVISAGGAAGSFGAAQVTLANAIARYHSAAPFDLHPGARAFRFMDCHALNGSSIFGTVGEPGIGQVSGFQIRGPDCELINCRVENMPSDGILIVNGADRCSLSGSTYISNVGYANGIGGQSDQNHGIQLQNVDQVRIGGNVRIYKTNGDGIDIDANGGGWTPQTVYLGGDVLVQGAGGYSFNNAGGLAVVPF